VPFIKVINEDEASGELKKVYNQITSARGKLSNIMKIHSLMPDTMIKHLELYLSIMFSKSNLSREEKEMFKPVREFSISLILPLLREAMNILFVKFSG